MTAQDYPISFPYGATSPPYNTSHPHRGDDRACPVGTPVVVAGVVIGLTGATGKVTGPHLHIQETQGGYLNTRKPQNSFKPGVVVTIDPNQTIGDGSFGKFVTIRNDDGWDDSYCHLSEIKVKVGQVLKGEQDMNDHDIETNIAVIAQGMTGKPATLKDFNDFRPLFKNNPTAAINTMFKNFEHDKRLAYQNTAPSTSTIPINKQVVVDYISQHLN